MTLNDTNQKIVDAVIRKGTEQYPGTLALLSLHGSVLTGDTHSGSDLDLNIVVNGHDCSDIAACFILEDIGVGYDLYCTSWEQLEQTAECRSPYISKLTDGEILYAADEEAKARFLALRRKASENLTAPFSARDAEIAEAHMTALKGSYFKAMTAEALSEVRCAAAEVIQEAIEAVMAANKRYFRLGVKRTFEEMAALKLPKDFRKTILSIIRETDLRRIKELLTGLAGEADRFLEPYRRLVSPPKQPPTRENLSGTYEEMISNWHKKVREAAAHNDLFAAFMAIASMSCMRNEEIGSAVDIPPQNVMECFDPADLPGTFQRFEAALDSYREEYAKIGLPVRRYPDVNGFIRDYLNRGEGSI